MKGWLNINLVKTFLKKKKSALRNLILAKNKSIVINDTDKNMGAADADKTDVISECERQLRDIKTYLKISEEELKQFITEIQNKLKRIVKSHMYKGNCTKYVKNVYI